jgi:hypothetical protein
MGFESETAIWGAKNGAGRLLDIQLEKILLWTKSPRVDIIIVQISNLFLVPAPLQICKPGDGILVKVQDGPATVIGTKPQSSTSH